MTHKSIITIKVVSIVPMPVIFISSVAVMAATTDIYNSTGTASVNALQLAVIFYKNTQLLPRYYFSN